MKTDREKPLPKAAYLGVDGRSYRILSPTVRIWIRRAEGYTHDLGEWTFETFAQANAHLGSAQKTAPKGGGYDKHDFEVAWACGFVYQGRFDLENNGQMPSLDAHIRQFLTFIVKNPCGGEVFSEEDRQGAAELLETRDIGQGAVPAPDDWEILRDYTRESDRGDFRQLQMDVFAASRTPG